MHDVLKLMALMLLGPIGFFAIVERTGWVSISRSTFERITTACVFSVVALLILAL